jgi:hypothetical protein
LVAFIGNGEFIVSDFVGTEIKCGRIYVENNMMSVAFPIEMVCLEGKL